MSTLATDQFPINLHRCFPGGSQENGSLDILPAAAFLHAPTTGDHGFPSVNTQSTPNGALGPFPSQEAHSTHNPTPHIAQLAQQGTTVDRQEQTTKALKRIVIQPGTTIDKYTIDQLIGQGGFAVVYKAKHNILQTDVALKIIRPKLSRQNPHLIRSICEEARFAAQINHPNVVRVLDATGNKKLAYIVMEFIDGPSPQQLIKFQKTLPAAAIVRIGRMVSAGLAAAHEVGLVHRDIKPGNIIVPRNGDPAKIVDLGLARPVMADDSSDGEENKPAIKAGGTPAFMAPEQALEPEKSNYLSDIYSLGATMFYAATGKAPYAGKDHIEVIRQHINAPTPRASSINPDVPQQLDDLIYHMMEKQPEDRPQSYEELGLRCQMIQRQLGSGTRLTRRRSNPN